jgi:60 kDa SS-A/Ro ribonucleoprotein
MSSAAYLDAVRRCLANNKNMDIQSTGQTNLTVTPTNCSNNPLGISHQKAIELTNNGVMNNAGGAVFKISPYKAFWRFIIIGATTATYYCKKEVVADEGFKLMESIFKGSDIELINQCLDLVKDVLHKGRAAKRDPSLLALSVASHSPNLEIRKKAWKIATDEISIPTDYFKYIKYCMAYNLANSGKRGWGTGFKKSVVSWLLKPKSGEDMLRLYSKYESRDGWSMRDILRLCHVNSNKCSADKQIALSYLAYGFVSKIEKNPNLEGTVKGLGLGSTSLANMLINNDDISIELSKTYTFNKALEQIKNEANVNEVIRLINEFNFPREVVPTNHLNDKNIWYALLVNQQKNSLKMGLTALIRNLGKMSNVGLFDDLNVLNLVVNELTNSTSLRKARIHPIQLVTALYTYKSGKGDKGSLTWPVCQALVDALDNAITLSFDQVEPTGKRILHAMDVSGSMGCAFISDSKLSARDATAVMVKAFMNSENAKTQRVMAFTNKLEELFSVNEANSIIVSTNNKQSTPHKIFNDDIKNTMINTWIKQMNLRDFISKISGLPFGTTDCSQPMLWALNNKVPIDCFIVYTDNETYAGTVKPVEALAKYRSVMGINAKLIVIGMTATNFSIADQNDPNSMDVVGFDTSTPSIINEFIVSNNN